MKRGVALKICSQIETRFSDMYIVSDVAFKKFAQVVRTHNYSTRHGPWTAHN